MGAGIAKSIDPSHIKNTRYFGICGYADFNYKEMVVLEKILHNQGTPHRFLYYDSKHLWPPEEICTRAIQWMELMACKESTDPKNDKTSFIAETFINEVKLATDREAKGELFYAANDFDAIACTFETLIDENEITELRTKAAHWKETETYKQFQGQDIIRVVVERNYYKKFAKGFDTIKKHDSKKSSCQN